METQVKQGEVKIDFRNFTIIGEESVAAGAAALAAGAQGRGWSFVELFYRNQGEENSGYADDDDFLKAIAKAAGVRDLAKWQTDRRRMTQSVERNHRGSPRTSASAARRRSRSRAHRRPKSSSWAAQARPKPSKTAIEAAG